MKILIITFTILLVSCSSLELKNIGKTTITTTSAYLVGGALPAIAVVGSAVVYDEIVPDGNKLADIKTVKQTIAYSMDGLYDLIFKIVVAFLLLMYMFNPLIKWVTNKFKKPKDKDK